MNALSHPSDAAMAGIAWVYLITNFARVFTYAPQIAAVWRCHDGARAISLCTWYSWTASNLASAAYGVLVIHDACFGAISTINFLGCATVANIAAQRRRQFNAAALQSQRPDAQQPDDHRVSSAQQQHEHRDNGLTPAPAKP